MHPEALVLVRTTVPGDADAQGLAQALVEAGLAACVHSWPIQSSYRWKGETMQGREVMVEARTTPGREQAVRDRMAEGHPYELPLIESVPVAVNPAYARWAAGAGSSG